MLDGENHGNAQVCVSGGISDTGVNENRMMVLRYHDRDDKNQRVKYVTKYSEQERLCESTGAFMSLQSCLATF